MKQIRYVFVVVFKEFILNLLFYIKNFLIFAHSLATNGSHIHLCDKLNLLLAHSLATNGSHIHLCDKLNLLLAWISLKRYS